MAPELSDTDVGIICERLTERYSKRDTKIGIRNAFIFRRDDASDESMGTYLPSPYDESKVIIKWTSGTLANDAQQKVASLTQNVPRIETNRVASSDRKVAQKAREQADIQEDVMNSILYEGSRHVNHQQRIAWWIVTEGAGWFLSLPRDASFGLPDRQYFDEMTDDEVEDLVNSGKATRTTDPTDLTVKPSESADLWRKRRMESSKDNAIKGRTLFDVQSYPERVVYRERDRQGLSYGAVIEEIPKSLFAPHSDMARMAAKYLNDETFADLGIRWEDNKIAAGLPEGTSRDDYEYDSRGSFVLVRLFTRTEIYYYVTSRGAMKSGKILWHSPHSIGEVPLYVSYGTDSGSNRPDEEYMPLLEGAYAFAPFLAQMVTLLSTAATYNATPRYVVERPDGSPVVDQATGQMKVITFEQTVGLDPEQIATIHGGRLRQLRIEDGDLLLNVVQFMLSQEQPTLSSPAERGTAGSSGPAHQTRQLIAQSERAYQPSVDAFTNGITMMARMWMRELRKLNVPLWFLAAPKRRRDGQVVRALIEADPSFFTDDINTRQDSRSMDQRLAMESAGLHLRSTGAIDDLRMYEEYFLETNPEEAILSKYTQRVIDAVLLGPNDQIQPGSLLYDISLALRGIGVEVMLQQSESFARGATDFLTSQIGVQESPNHQGSNDFQRGGGSAATEAAGVRQPGVGDSIGLQQLPPLAGPV